MKKKDFNPLADDVRQRIFLVLLYPDNAEHLQVIYQLTNYYKCVGIKHDKDVYQDDIFDTDGKLIHKKGDLKKPHYHFVIEYDNPRYRNGVAKDLGIDVRFVQLAENFIASKEYLLHRKQPEKYQYNLDELVGCLSGKLIKKLTEMTEETQMQLLVAYIDHAHEGLSMRELYDYAIKHGCFPTYRRCYSILTEFVFLHNGRLGANSSGIKPK
jgi:hypothetical protein